MGSFGSLVLTKIVVVAISILYLQIICYICDKDESMETDRVERDDPNENLQIL